MEAGKMNKLETCCKDDCVSFFFFSFVLLSPSQQIMLGLCGNALTHLLWRRGEGQAFNGDRDFLSSRIRS
jgi:hypothetical protein